ncbi:MAG TPA: MlaD family protein [Flavitalea sp.]|nr:MlaD family protein [Flavitalea sp.]
MKISNETKVGALTAIAIVVLILGFNYLKGKNLTERDDELYAIFPDVKGLTVSNAVFINGLQVGKVSEMRETDKNLSGILVSLRMTKDINIPRNSAAIINSEILGSTSMEIVLGDERTYVQNGDTLHSTVKTGIMAEITKSINPAINNVNKTLSSLDMLIKQLSDILDPNTRNNLQGIIVNLTNSSKSLERMINAQNGVLARSLANVESITGNLSKNNERISNTLANLEKTTSALSNANFQEVLTSMKNTMNKLEATVEKISSTKGSLGALLNDRQLYDEIRLTNRSLTTLLDDVRVNPKRYVNISVFGKKDKKGPLMNPITDSVRKN